MGLWSFCQHSTLVYFPRSSLYTGYATKTVVYTEDRTECGSKLSLHTEDKTRTECGLLKIIHCNIVEKIGFQMQRY